jgi:hypothetical protein
VISLFCRTAQDEVFVKAKFAGALTPGTVAVTVYDPTVKLAVTVFVVACPLAFVVSVLLVNVALAPDAGTVNATVTPDKKLPQLSVTVATRSVEKSSSIGVFCGVPLVATTFAGVPFGWTGKVLLSSPLTLTVIPTATVCSMELRGAISVMDWGVTAVTWGDRTVIVSPGQLKATAMAVGSLPKFVPVSVIVFPLTVMAVRFGAAAATVLGREAAWFRASADTKTMPKTGGLTTPATNPSVAACPVGTPRFTAIARPIKKENMLNLIRVSAPSLEFFTYR